METSVNSHASKLRLWRIVPATTADDPNWLGLEIWSQVIVRAASSGEARVHAACLSADAPRTVQDLKRGGREGGFMSEKLYLVQPLTADEAETYEESGPGVLRATRAGIAAS